MPQVAAALPILRVHLISLRDIVFQELDTAADENGYPLERWPAGLIADDLVNYSPAVDDRDAVELMPYVEEWLQQRRAG